jgi:tetratricopeptide (TPR) repeat protein
MTLIRPTRRWIGIRLATGFAVLIIGLVAHGQSGRAVPGSVYYLARASFDAGEYQSALRGFREAARSGIRSTLGRWVDSICYYTMAGECYHHLGQPKQALEQHELALNLFLEHKDWLQRIDFPAVTPSASSVRAQISWGTRTTVLGHFPETMRSLQGNIDQRNVLQGGGVVSPPRLYPLDVVEVVRCIAVSLRRRNELLGPAAKYSPLTSRLVGVLSSPLVTSRHWANAWTECQLGIALAGAGDVDEAVSHLAGAVVAAGDFDHPLTGTALVELGKLALNKGEYREAGALFFQGTIAAAEFGHADLLAEAFEYLLVCHLAAKEPAIFPAIDGVLAFAERYDFDRVQVSLLLSACEIAASTRQPQAAAFLEQARRALARRDMAAGDIGARLSYLAAWLAYQGGKVPQGNELLAQAMSFQQRNSRRLFQLAMADQLYLSRNETISSRIADQLFASVLREPDGRDWAHEPMEAMTVLLTPHPQPLEHWFEVALERNNPEKAAEIAQQLQRHRFHSSLPMGGRLLSLQWMLEGPAEMLGKTARQQAENLKTKYPLWTAASRDARKSQEELDKLPLVPQDDQQVQQQRGLLAKLAQSTRNQETILREIALGRDPSSLVFPPPGTLKQVQSALGDDEAVLAFITTSRRWHAFLIRKGDFRAWAVKSPAEARKQLVALLRALGNQERNHALGIDQLQGEEWKEPATALWNLLSGQLPSDSWEGVQELVIVPDGVLWYLPFEVLQVPHAAGATPLCDRVQLRYAPLTSLAVRDQRGRPKLMRTAVVAGRLFPRDEPALAMQTAERLGEALPATELLSDTLPGPSSLLSPHWDRLLVLDEVEDTERGPYRWAPAQVDRGQNGGLLSDWMELPWGAPYQVVLPGFHTAAENGLRRQANGQEIFLSVCGLMAAGTRTALLSRWRVGGQSTLDLMREFVQELPHEPGSRAWQRSVQLLRASELDPQSEPRVNAASGDELITGDHPFFWAGYLLVDTGAAPEPEVDEEQERPNAAARQEAIGPANDEVAEKPHP